MSEATRTEILVRYEEGRLTFLALDPEGEVVLQASGHLKVPKGDHWIRFTRLAGTGWRFSGFRYTAEPDDPRGPITSISMTDSFIEILDANHHDLQEPQRFDYEIQILTPSGELIWIDPVIENKPGMAGSGAASA